MAIGRTFQESLQKALRGLETGKDGLNEISTDRTTIHHEISEPGPERLWYLADAFRLGYSVADSYHATKIDPWFLAQIKELVEIEAKIKETSLEQISREEMYYLKRKGFSDRRLPRNSSRL